MRPWLVGRPRFGAHPAPEPGHGEQARGGSIGSSAVTALQDRLAGTFHLVSLETRRSDGVVSSPFGRGVIGLFMFDRAGNFAVQLMGDHAMAMFGTYVVDETQRTFTLTPVGALDRALIGTEVVRHVDPGHDDVAVFSTPVNVADGMESTTFITWRKVASA